MCVLIDSRLLAAKAPRLGKEAFLLLVFCCFYKKADLFIWRKLVVLAVYGWLSYVYVCVS